ncbi:hypothetical protein B0H11DRAFT_31025, partial [Mycena galericulata]
RIQRKTFVIVTVHVGYDGALTGNLEALLQVCVGVQKLRKEVPPARPADESLWAPLVNKVINLAAGTWKAHFEIFEGTPPAQAMPRPFARTREQNFHDSVGLPRSFTPDRGIYLKRRVSNDPKLSPRQRRCLTANKTWSSTPSATFPVITAEIRKSIEDLPQAEGVALYFAVQAAGIYANCGSTEYQTLTLVVANGFVFPKSSSWGGSEEADVNLVSGPTLDLGELADTISFFLMVYNAARAHIQAAIKVSVNALETGMFRMFHNAAPIVIKPAPLVDWRARVLPPSLMPTGRKRRATNPAGRTPSNRSTENAQTATLADTDADASTMAEDAGVATADGAAGRVKRRRIDTVDIKPKVNIDSEPASP